MLLEEEDLLSSSRLLIRVLSIEPPPITPVLRFGSMLCRSMDSSWSDVLSRSLSSLFEVLEVVLALVLVVAVAELVVVLALVDALSELADESADDEDVDTDADAVCVVVENVESPLVLERMVVLPAETNEVAEVTEADEVDETDDADAVFPPLSLALLVVVIELSLALAVVTVLTGVPLVIMGPQPTYSLVVVVTQVVVGL